MFEFFFKYKAFLFQRGHLSWGGSVWLYLLLVGTATAALLLVYRQRDSKRGTGVNGRNAWFLVAIRASVFALIILALFRPTLHVSTLLSRQNIAAILLDDSQSMTINDAGKVTRLQAVQNFLNPEKTSFMKDLEKRFRTRVFRFSKGAEKLDSIQGLHGVGKQTGLETALEDVIRELEGAPLASVVLFTDGADNTSRSLASMVRKLQSAKIAVNVCAVGNPQIEKDVEVVQASMPQTTLPGSISSAVVSLRSNGYAGKHILLEIREAGKLVQSKEVVLTHDGEIQTIDLSLASSGKGLKSYTVSVAPLPGEAITLNNSRNLLLNIADSRPKILYLEGTPRWEFKFIRESVAPDKSLQLMTLLRTSGNKFYRQGVESEDNLASGFPATKEELFQYKGLILGSIEASFFSGEQLRMISDFVSERGGGFMMLGGKSSFDAGKYAGTPIAELLPVVLGQTSPANSFVLEPVKVRLSQYGLSHLTTRLALEESENEKRWNSLPPLPDYNFVSMAKPGATVLASGEDGRRKAILLATHRYGRGRAIAFMTASSWIWQMEMPHEDDSHEIFWRQTLRWLAGSSPDPVNLSFDRSAVLEGETINLTVEANSAAFVRLNDAAITATLTSPSGKLIELSVPWTGQKDGLYQREYGPTEKGNYRVQIAATEQGKELGRAEGFFSLTDSNIEFFNAGQNRELLEHLATETGGRYYTLESAAQLPEEMTYVERPNSVPQILPLWDMPILLMLISGLLIAEWVWRKRLALA